MTSRLRWRDYRTQGGGCPVHDFVESLTDDEAAAVVAAMREVRDRGLSAARHLRGDIYEVRAFAARRGFRILFSKEAKYILLSLSAYVKKTAKTPAAEIDLAVERLADWRRRGRSGIS